MKYQLEHGSHSTYFLRFHYVCCTKYRRKVLTPKVSVLLKKINLDVADRFGIKIIEQETDMDHIYILFASRPQIHYPSSLTH